MAKPIIQRLLTVRAARLLIDEINHGAANVRSKLLQLHDGEGWRALEYESWQDCVEHEFVFGRNYAWRQLEAARIEQRLLPIGNMLGPFGLLESHARELAAVPEAKQLEVYRRAWDTSPNGLTAEHIRKTIVAMGLRRRSTLFEDEMSGPRTRRFASSGLHCTPVEFLSAIEGRFDVIEMDLAATKQNAVGPHFISPKEDSLEQDWSKLIKRHIGYLNPPFDPMSPWAEKAVEQSSLGTRFVVLCQASIGADWFWQMFPLCATYALSPRLKFVGHDTGFPRDLVLCAFNLVGIGVRKSEVGRITRWFWKRENDQRLVKSF